MLRPAGITQAAAAMSNLSKPRLVITISVPFSVMDRDAVNENLPQTASPLPYLIGTAIGGARVDIAV